MENRAHALAAGLFVLCMAIATAVAIWWFRQDHEARTRYLLETRHGVGGLNKEAVVRYRGIRAGKVEDIDVDPKDPRLILVRINLDQDFVLTQGTRARLAAQGITGLTFIALDDDGSQPTPLVAPPGEMARIPLKPALMDSMADQAEAMLAQLNAVTARLERILSEKNAANLERSIDNLARSSDDLPAVIQGLKLALSAENMQRFSQTLAHVEKTAGEAAPLTRDVRELVGRLNQLAKRAESVLGAEGDPSPGRATVQRANRMLDEVGLAVRQLNRLVESLEESPQSLLFGRPPAPPGPGEPGFNAGAKP